MNKTPPEEFKDKALKQLERVRDASAIDTNHGGEDWTLSDKVMEEALARLVALHEAEMRTARRSERAWAYKNMRDHGTDKEWVEVAKQRYERSHEAALGAVGGGTVNNSGYAVKLRAQGYEAGYKQGVADTKSKLGAEVNDLATPDTKLRVNDLVLEGPYSTTGLANPQPKSTNLIKEE